MTIATRAELRAEISAYMHRTDLADAQLDNFVDAAGYRLGSGLRSTANEGRNNITDDLTANFYRLPQDWVETRAVFVAGAGNSGPRLLQLLSESEIQRYRSSGSDAVGYLMNSPTELVGQPAENYVIRLFPKTGEDITLDYYQDCVLRFPAGASASHPALVRYPTLYLYAALIEAHTFTMDFTMRDQLLGIYAAELDQANAAAMRARLVPGGRVSTSAAPVAGSAPSRVM